MAEITRLAKERLEEINVSFTSFSLSSITDYYLQIEKQLVKEEPRFIKREVYEVYDLTEDGTSALPAKARRFPSEVIDLTDD